MEYFSDHLIIYILEFLDFKSLCRISTTCNYLNCIISSNLFQQRRIKTPIFTNSYFVGPFYSYKQNQNIAQYFWSTHQFENPLNLLRWLGKNINFPSSLNIQLSGSSFHIFGSEFRDGLTRIQAESLNQSNQGDYFDFQLKDNSIIYGVHFYRFELIHPQSVTFSMSSLVQIRVFSKQGYAVYLSPCYQLTQADYYHSFLVLPQVVIGKKIRIEILTWSPQPPYGRNIQIEWKHIAVSGYTRTSWMKPVRRGLPCLMFGIQNEWLSPHTVGMVESNGRLEQSWNLFRHPLWYNNLGAYVFMALGAYDRQSTLEIYYQETELFGKYSNQSEPLADLLYERECYREAGHMFSMLGNLHKKAKCSIKMGKFEGLRGVFSVQDLISIAGECEQKDLEGLMRYLQED